MAEVTATAPLVILDLRTIGLLKLGVSTDAAQGKEHREGEHGKVWEALKSMVFAADRTAPAKGNFGTRLHLQA